MSWRQYADMAQDTILDILGERTAAGGLSVSYSPDGVAAATDIRALYLDAHTGAELDLEVDVSTVEPIISTKISELSAFVGGYPPAPGAQVTIQREQGDPRAVGSQTFDVIDHHPDGEGMVALLLAKA